MRQGATFVLVSLTCLATFGAPCLAGEPWSLSDDLRGVRVPPLFLLSRADVRQDLRIAPDQVLEIDKAINDLFEQAATLKGKTGQAAIDGRKLVDDGQKEWLEKHLTPDQVDRLWQVDLLWEGPASMVTRFSIAESLALSDEQKAALTTALRERNALRSKTKDVAAANHQFGARALTILSDGQKQRWASLVGRPIAHKPATPTSPAATASTAPTDRAVR